MKKMIIALSLITASLVCLISITSPKNSPLVIYMGMFVLLYAFFNLLLRLIIKMGFNQISGKKALFVASVLAFCPVIMLALYSVGSLTVLDFIIAFSLPAVIAWYGLRNGHSS